MHKMRSEWRSIFLRTILNRSSSSIQSPIINLQPQKVPRNFFSVSSYINTNAPEKPFNSQFRNPRSRNLPSKQAQLISVALTDILSKSSSNSEIKTGFHERIFDTLITNLKRRSRDSRIAKLVRNFSKNELLDHMLYLFGRKEYVDHFWVLVEVMKRKGLGITKRVYISTSENFEKEGMVDELAKLKELYVKKTNIENVCSKVCMIIRENEWGVDVRKKLTVLTSDWSNELVTMSIEDLGLQRTEAFENFDGDDEWDVKVHNEIISYWHPRAVSLAIEPSGVHSKKALMFFRWVEEKPNFRHTKLSYNAILRVLSLGDCIDEFWRVAGEMKDAGCEMDMKTYDSAMKAFYKRGMFKDAFHLYEWMVSCSSNPSALKEHSFQSTAEKFEDTNARITNADFPFDSLVQHFSLKDRAEDAYKLLIGMIDNTELKPLEGTYRMLIRALLSHGKWDEILNLFWLMRNTHGYAPWMMSVFKEFLNAGMRSEARIMLSYCPKYIRNNQAVRLLFCTEDPDAASFRENHTHYIQNDRISLYKKREVLRASRAAYLYHRF